MADVFKKAKVKLNEAESTKLMKKLGSDMVFARSYRRVLMTQNETKLALFLKKNGFKLK